MGPTISSEAVSGNINVTLSPGTGTNGSTVYMNFTVNDTLNATSWFNFTFPSGFNIAGAIINYLINGVTSGWVNATDYSTYINISGGGTVAYSGNTSYFNFSNITLTGGVTSTYITVRTNNSEDIPVNYNMTAGVTYIPPTPTNLAVTQSNYWINYTWQTGSGNATDSYNVSVNGTWNNGSAINYSNRIFDPHNWSNISVYAYNSSGTGTLNSTPATATTQVTNNVPVQTGICPQSVTAGNWLNISVVAADADGDTITYGTNASKGVFGTLTGNFETF